MFCSQATPRSRRMLSGHLPATQAGRQIPPSSRVDANSSPGDAGRRAGTRRAPKRSPRRSAHGQPRAPCPHHTARARQAAAGPGPAVPEGRGRSARQAARARTATARGAKGGHARPGKKPAAPLPLSFLPRGGRRCPCAARRGAASHPARGAAGRNLRPPLPPGPSSGAPLEAAAPRKEGGGNRGAPSQPGGSEALRGAEPRSPCGRCPAATYLPLGTCWPPCLRSAPSSRCRAGLGEEGAAPAAPPPRSRPHPAPALPARAQDAAPRLEGPPLPEPPGGEGVKNRPYRLPPQRAHRPWVGRAARPQPAESSGVRPQVGLLPEGSACRGRAPLPHRDCSCPARAFVPCSRAASVSPWAATCGSWGKVWHTCARSTC